MIPIIPPRRTEHPDDAPIEAFLVTDADDARASPAQKTLRVLVAVLALVGACASAFLGYRWKSDADQFERIVQELIERRNLDPAAAWELMRAGDGKGGPGLDELDTLVKASWFFMGAAVLGVMGVVLALFGRGKSAAALLLLAPVGPFVLVAQVLPDKALLTLVFTGALFLAGLLALLVRRPQARASEVAPRRSRLDPFALAAACVAVLYIGAWTVVYAGWLGTRSYESTVSPLQTVGADELQRRRELAQANERKIMAAHRRPGSVKLVTLKGAAGDFAFSPDSTRLAIVNGDDSIAIWDLLSVKLVRTLSVKSKPDKILFAPGGDLLSGMRGGNISNWNTDAGELKSHYRLASSDWHAVSPDGSRLACSDLLRDLPTGLGAKPFRLDREGSFTAVAFSPDAAFIASATGTNGHVVLRRAHDDALVHTFKLAPERALAGPTISALAFSPDGKTLAIGGAPSLLRLADLETKEVRTLPASDSPRQLGFNADGSTLLTGGWNKTRFWHAASGTEGELSESMPSGLLAVSPGGLLFAVGSGGSDEVQIWKIPKFGQ